MRRRVDGYSTGTRSARAKCAGSWSRSSQFFSKDLFQVKIALNRLKFWTLMDGLLGSCAHFLLLTHVVCFSSPISEMFNFVWRNERRPKHTDGNHSSQCWHTSHTRRRKQQSHYIDTLVVDNDDDKIIKKWMPCAWPNETNSEYFAEVDKNYSTIYRIEYAGDENDGEAFFRRFTNYESSEGERKTLQL